MLSLLDAVFTHVDDVLTSNEIKKTHSSALPALASASSSTEPDDAAVAVVLSWTFQIWNLICFILDTFWIYVNISINFLNIWNKYFKGDPFNLPETNSKPPPVGTGDSLHWKPINITAHTVHTPLHYNYITPPQVSIVAFSLLSFHPEEYDMLTLMSSQFALQVKKNLLIFSSSWEPTFLDFELIYLFLGGNARIVQN